MNALEDIHGHDVKVYSSDTGHPVQEESESQPASKERLAAVRERCREQVVLRPWTALALASLAGGALGAVAGFYARGRR
ncbi:hypothetical protein [Azoarcus sp. KH32C]|uniref:hypothetical protein n=1 Tax=Azoarcus sp. KH32C TaxID=748247 RepID=UPI0002386EDF|nr:hypothetical protein [Azoarcus sp. KH32C]BAL24970.1 hypothetical protein AZKH_2664 [Azoarcus sp. KH32C]